MRLRSKVIIGSSDGTVWSNSQNTDSSVALETARGFHSNEKSPHVAIIERTRARNVFYMIKGNAEAFRKVLEEKPDKDWINMDALLPVEHGRSFDLNHLLQLRPRSMQESRTITHLLRRVIDQRWQDGNYQLSLDSKPDLSAFDGVPVTPYEYMDARVAPGAIIGGLGKLHVRFPAGCREQAKMHTHPGARIVSVVSGEGEFFAHRRAEEPEELHASLQQGSVILMPGNTPHNFVAGEAEDMNVVSIHVGYQDITRPEAMTYLDSTSNL